ncbi:MAG: ATP-dependent DNA helicase [Microthrixaceae bacterium]
MTAPEPTRHEGVAPLDPVVAALSTVTGSLAGGGEDRPGQVTMAKAVAEAIEEERHLVVQAGTGTGKSLAYLVPAVLSGKRTVVATATKALQDQLAEVDLPFLAQALDRKVRFAVLKGRSNYACLQRVDEVNEELLQGSLELDDGADDPQAELADLVEWASTTDVGDKAELERDPSVAAWSAVSVGPRECPGASNCSRGEDCFAEAARVRAAAADVVVVNTHLWGLNLAADGMVLPPHDVAILDEAHTTEEVISSVCGTEITAGRFASVARNVAAIVADPALVAQLDAAGRGLSDDLEGHRGERLDDLDDALMLALSQAQAQVSSAMDAVRKVPSESSVDVATRKARALTAATALADDLTQMIDPSADQVRFVNDDPGPPRLRLAPLAVADTLDRLLWNPDPTVREHRDRPGDDRIPPGNANSFDPANPANPADPGHPDDPADPAFDGAFGGGFGDDTDDDWPPTPKTVILTSATIPSGMPKVLGMPGAATEVLDVGSPFDYQHQALLYCATSLPDVRDDGYAEAMRTELDRLIRAAGGRTLALFTSHRAMTAAHDELAKGLPFPVLRQGEHSKAVLVRRFTEDEPTCLFATMGYWQGIDVPGPTLSLVTIDRLPFARPDDPLLDARRERAGAAAFKTIDVPRAAMLLAQGTGRLIRSSNDRGVVVVFDRRLATARSYRWDLISALPPMRRTKDRAEVIGYLRQIRDGAETG